MAPSARRFSRRTFLLATGGGAASVSIVWGVSELGLPFLGAGDDSPISVTFDAPVEYDGWLVTAEEKARLVLVEFADGWYARETAGGSSWRWTERVATLAFPNPRTVVVLDLDLFEDSPRSAHNLRAGARAGDARADLFEDSPRALTISVGDQVARSLALDVRGRRRINVLIPALMLGRQDRVEVRIAVDGAFVPANLNPDSRDTRELGIQVYSAVVERSSTPSR